MDDLLGTTPNPEAPQEPGPEWICICCGSVNKCHTIKYDTPGEPIDYDLECNDCGSREFEEGYHSALHHVLDQRDRTQEALDGLKEKVEKSLYSIYRDWHGCALGTRKNPIHAEDRARGLKDGQLCDDCNGMIKAYMKDLFGG